ncbi:hypothetical protein [Plebeiibacterium marinum]|uniref:Uncharacterized protein n=1 Tax=Plebeiibacterium marinum TaxID=2992111 RepID=A0AAE3MGM9_9BACT|nr:hypothetical protein [Plebeiobacterium marinum]MCW3807136.1 hypothetical protein [Plebeiobacterium marinum]
MEYIELDIKQEIYELAKGKVVPHSVELNCEIFGCTYNKVYGCDVYVSDEKDGVVEVIADFNCLVYEDQYGNDGVETKIKGSFKGLFNLDIKCFVEDTSVIRL